jgi:hypothetical protein
MNWTILISTILAIAGWFAGNFLSEARDQKNKKREIKVKLLMEAYLALEYSAHRDFGGEIANSVDDAMAKIQLVGSPEQVKLAVHLINEFAEAQTIDWAPLLLSLRDDLRRELALSEVSERITVFRFKQHIEQ